MEKIQLVVTDINPDNDHDVSVSIGCIKINEIPMSNGEIANKEQLLSAIETWKEARRKYGACYCSSFSAEEFTPSDFDYYPISVKHISHILTNLYIEDNFLVYEIRLLNNTLYGNYLIKNFTDPVTGTKFKKEINTKLNMVSNSEDKIFIINVDFILDPMLLIKDKEHE